MDLSNREYALVIWIALLIAALCIAPSTRKSVLAVLKALCQPIILKVLGLAGSYILLCVYLLHGLHLWHIDNLKTTLIWSFGFAFLSTVNARKIDEDRRYFVKGLRETFALTVVISFIADSYTFSLPVELALVPFITFITLLQVMAGGKAEHKAVGRLAGGIMVAVGFAYIIHAFAAAISDWKNFLTFDNGRDFFVPIWLSVLFFPFLYLLNIYQVYESFFIGLRFAIDDEQLRAYAKRRAILSFGSNLVLLKRWRRMILRDRPADRKDIERSISDLRAITKREANPPLIRSGDGWSPYKAKQFLADRGYITDDYDRMYANEWRSASKPVTLGERYSLDSITYFIEGDERRATRLTLELHIFDAAKEPTDTPAKFGALIGQLLHAALDEATAKAFVDSLVDATDTEVVAGHHKLLLKRDEWTIGDRTGYEMTLILSMARAD